MKTRLPVGLVLIAIFQFVAPLTLPVTTLQTISPVIWVAIVLLFALLGIALLRRRAWARVATIFIQGFNIIVRVLVVMSHAVVGGRPGGPLDVPLVSTSLISIAISALILYYIDLPDVQVIMQ
jgi:hypothetical protein